MADAGGPSAAVRAPAAPGPVRFVRLPGAALAALVDENLARASELAGVTLTGYFVTPDAVRLWRLRRDQIAADPASARWIARAVVTADGAVVGHAGFHGPPDPAGLVEVAYSVDPAHRRRGYATAMLSGLLRRAAAEPGVRTVRATIRPDNTGSLATISGFGFARNGEQWDEEDGLELVFDRSAGWPGAEEAHTQRVPSLRAGRPGAGQPGTGQPGTGQPGTGPMITTEMIRSAAVLAAGQIAPGDDDMVPQVGGALLDAFDAPARFGDPAGGSAIRVLVAVANGMFGLAAGAGRAETAPGATAPRVELVSDPDGPGTGVLIWGPAGDVAAAAGGAVLDAAALVSWARQQAFSRIYAGEPGAAAAAVRAASGLEIVLLLDPGIGGGLWVDVDPAAQAPAATLLVEMTLPPGGGQMFRVLSP